MGRTNVPTIEHARTKGLVWMAMPKNQASFLKSQNKQWSDATHVIDLKIDRLNISLVQLDDK